MSVRGWAIPEWNKARVPSLREFVVDCMEDVKDTRMYPMPGWRGHNPWSWWYETAPKFYWEDDKNNKVFSMPRYRRYLLDYCARQNKQCGDVVALRYCRLRGYERVVAFEKAPNVKKRTRHIASHYICKQKHCDGFAFIHCQRD